MKAIKHVPNALSAARIVLDLSLLFFAYYTPWWVFAIVYFAAGLTDVLDGWIARKYNVESSLGSKLDAWGDTLLFASALICMAFLVDLEVDVPRCLFVLSFGVVYKLANVVVTRVRFGEWNMMHTIMNKMVFVTLFFYVPIFMALGEVNNGMILGITIAVIIACMEETLTLMKLETYDVSHKGIITTKVLSRINSRSRFAA